MIPKEKEILVDLVESIRVDVIDSLKKHGRYASGKTEENTTVVEVENKIELQAPFYVTLLETGRPPTSPDAQPGNPTLFEAIKEWIAAKGLDLNPFAVTKKIHDKGFLGIPGVLSDPLSESNINKRVDEAAGSLASLLIWDTLKIKI